MYELTCPTCQHKATAPFIRVGASVVCGGCDKRFVIEQAHVTRRVATPQPARPVAAPVETTGDSPPPNAPRVDSEGNVIGLSGLSEMMRKEGGPVKAAPGKAAPMASAQPVASQASPKTEAPSGIGRLKARQQRRKRASHSAMLLVLLMFGVVLLIAGSGILVYMSRDDSPVVPTQQEKPIDDNSAKSSAEVDDSIFDFDHTQGDALDDTR